MKNLILGKERVKVEELAKQVKVNPQTNLIKVQVFRDENGKNYPCNTWVSVNPSKLNNPKFIQRTKRRCEYNDKEL